jgi:hypothetical protein
MPNPHNGGMGPLFVPAGYVSAHQAAQPLGIGLSGVRGRTPRTPPLWRPVIHTGAMTTATAPAPLLIDTYAAALEAGLKPATLRQWVSRGRLDHHGYDRAGRTIIDLHQLRAIIALDRAGDLL